MSEYYISTDLSHSGIQGMKWGIRRYQNEDGTLTPEGRMRYAKKAASYEHKIDLANKKHDIELKNAQTFRNLVPPAKRLANKSSREARRSLNKAKRLAVRRDKLVSDLSEDEINAGREQLELERAAVKTALSVPVSMLKYSVIGTPMYFIDAGQSFMDERRRIKEKYE